MRLHFTSSVKRSSMHVCMQYANMTDVRRLPSLSEVSTDVQKRQEDFMLQIWFCSACAFNTVSILEYRVFAQIVKCQLLLWKMIFIFWFHFVKCQNLLLFFVSHLANEESLGFGVFVRQKNQFKDNMMNIFDIFWVIKYSFNHANNQQIYQYWKWSLTTALL